MGKLFGMLRAMDAFTAHDGGGVEELAQAAPVTCPTCGAVVEDDALARQTMADGSLMWPQPFCAACLLAGLKRLKAWLAAGGAGALGEDGE